MRPAELDYELPREIIAQRPLDVRSESRLMDLTGPAVAHRRFTDIETVLRAGDCLLVNDSRVIPARIRCARPTGGRCEVLLVRPRDGARWEALVSGTVKRLPLRLAARDGAAVEVVERLAPGRYVVDLGEASSIAALARIGEMPTPPYIKERLGEPERYQTVYARADGSVAAPTAGLHFTMPLLARLRHQGVRIAAVTLHVGPGTFLPIHADDLSEHRMEPEAFSVPPATAELVNRTLAAGGRLAVVGTTTMRVLESRWDPAAGLVPGEGATDLFIRPGHAFRAPVGLFVTNFHLPRSTLLALVCAYGGRERVLAAYAEAVRERYRFYSFGDAMVLGPPSAAPGPEVA